MPLPTTESEISADVMAQLRRIMFPPTPSLDRIQVLAEAFREAARRDADEIARLERRDQERQDDVWQARADERGEGETA